MSCDLARQAPRRAGWHADGVPEMPFLAKKLTTSAPYRLFARRVVLPWVLQGVQPTGHGLEIGAGSGAMTAQLLAAFPDLHMIATDYDADMVHTAHKTLAPFGGRASVEQADAADLPFAHDRFDLVLSAAMLHHVLAWEKALAEAVRVLRPDGRLLGYDLVDTPPIRLLHVGGRHDTTLLRPGQLQAELGQLPVTNLRTSLSLGGLVIRFAASKTG